jgi:NAD(P)-dependent dehydrogenase (short-subunit alcohol dehydrogenase family)
MRFDGRVAIVTGAGGNPSLGRAYARLLAARGARVVVNDIGSGAALPGCSDNAAAETVVKEILDEGGEAVADTNSVATEQSAVAVVDTALEAFGRVDILVNNAGVCIFAPVDEISADDIRLTLDVHVLGTIWMSRAVWPHMRAARYGRIVNITSGAMNGLRLLTVYGSAKGGIFSFTRTLAIEGSDHNIRANSLSPAAGTRMASTALREDSAFLKFMLSRPPELVAPAVAFLAHEDCPVNGENFTAGGGEMTRVFLSHTAGYTHDAPTIESIRDNFATIMDPSGAKINVIPTLGNEVDVGAKPYGSEI